MIVEPKPTTRSEGVEARRWQSISRVVRMEDGCCCVRLHLARPHDVQKAGGQWGDRKQRGGEQQRTERKLCGGGDPKPVAKDQMRCRRNFAVLVATGAFRG